MACKNKCGDETVDSKYDCHACLIKKGTFKWCVITKANKNINGHEEGNLYDTTIDFNDIIDIWDGKVYTLPKRKRGKAYLHMKAPVFTKGEMFPVSKDFGREMIYHGRAPHKWDIEYEEFPARQYKKALLRALESSRASWNEDESDNLANLEAKYEKLVKLDTLKKELKESKDPLKLVYSWIKNNRIFLDEARQLIGELK